MEVKCDDIEEDDDDIKVILVGEMGTGKTSLINTSIGLEFKDKLETTKTSSILNKTIKIDDHDYSINLWDTIGQEKYRSLTTIFMKDAKIIIFVYDIANSKSFESIKKYWYPQIKVNSLEDAILVLVANKNDLYNYQQVNDEEVKSYAESIGAIFHKTSAKSNSSVNVLFEIVGKIILDPNYDYKNEENDKPFNDIGSISVKLNKIISKKKHRKNCC